MPTNSRQTTAGQITVADIIGAGVKESGNIYIAKNSSDSDYGHFYRANNVEYPDGTNSVHGTVMSAINAARYKPGTTDINYDDGHHATVIITPGDYSAEGRVAFSAKNITIVGLGTPGTDAGVTFIPDSPSTFAFGGSGSGVEISNIYIGVASAVIGLYWELMDGGCNFHDIYIKGNASNATYGICTNGLKGNSKIENCMVSDFVTSGISLVGGADAYFTDSKIVGNRIGASATCATAIYVAGSGNLVSENSLVAHNYIIGDNFTKTIDIDATAANVMSADNWGYAAGEGGTERDNHVT